MVGTSRDRENLERDSGRHPEQQEQLLPGAALTPQMASRARGLSSPKTIVGGRLRKAPTRTSLDTSLGTASTTKDEALSPPPPPRISDGQALKLAFCKPLNLLLLCLPPAIASVYLEWGVNLIFGLNFLAILPLAGLLGHATEELALKVGETLGGLLNATFGNAVEMILAVFALEKGLVRVVQGTLLGSILSNLLLVLGMCFVFGGYFHHVQSYNPSSSRSQGALLLLSVLALAVPTTVMMGHTDVPAPGEDKATRLLRTSELNISRGSAVVLAVIYVLYLFFQLRTHSDLFLSEEAIEEDDEVGMSVCCSVTLLFVSTAIVAVCSEGLVGSLEGLTESMGISQSFIGVVLLPIVGNAAEHMTAVTVATKNKMDLSIGVALGSSTQIALFVVPFTVLAGWALEVPMDLNFYPVETGILLLTVLIVCFITSDGKSNWMEGVMLIAAYIIIAVTFWFIG